MTYQTWLPILLSLGKPGGLLAQERMYEWHWQMHPMWWGWGIGMMAMMFLFWALIIVGLVVGIRWLFGKDKSTQPDSALKILRQRYARGEINKDEFEAKKKDLGG
jgi:putative membrane protein